jgi:hypothetical protein
VACRQSWPVVFLTAGTLPLVSPIPVHSEPVARAKTCGPFASRAPSTVGLSGTGMVSTALGFKDATDLREAVLCLINAERRSDPPTPLTPGSPICSAQCDCVHMRSTPIVPQDIPTVTQSRPHPCIACRESGVGHDAVDLEHRKNFR